MATATERETAARSRTITGGHLVARALERARSLGKATCVNVMIDPNVYSSGTMNQTMHK